MTVGSPRLAVVFSNLGHTCTHLFVALYATAVLHLPGVFDRPYGELLGLSSLGLVLFGVAALPAGWLGDRWSQVGMMVALFLGIGLGAVVAGTAGQVDQLFLGLTLIGVFAAIYHPVGLAWLVASAQRQGASLGINGALGNLGNAIAPLFVGLMVDFVSWRAAFVLPGILAVVSGGVLLFFWRTGRVEDARTDRAAPVETDAGAARRVFLLLTVTMACNGFVYAAVTNTMPKLFQLGLFEGVGQSYTRIGATVGAVVGISSLSSALGGYLADRFSARSIYLVCWTLQVPLLMGVASLGGPPLLAATFVVMNLNLTFAAAENLLVARYTPFRWRALAYGAKFVLALGVGGLTVWLAGELFDATGGFSLLYSLLAAAAAVAAAAALFLPGRAGAVPRAV